MNYRQQIIAWLLLLTLAVISSCSDDPPVASDTVAEASAKDTPSADLMFEERCAVCHADPANTRAP